VRKDLWGEVIERREQEYYIAEREKKGKRGGGVLKEIGFIHDFA
jgi:hypothetical protein